MGSGRIVGWLALPVVAGAMVYVLIGVLSGGGQVPARDPLDAYNQSAHPIMYVIPGYFSTYGDFSLWQETGWGKPMNEFLVTRVPRAYGTDLYLGWSVLLLAGHRARLDDPATAGVPPPPRAARSRSELRSGVCWLSQPRLRRSPVQGRRPSASSGWVSRSRRPRT